MSDEVTIGEDEDGAPLLCLRCGEPKGEEELFMHMECWFGPDGDWENYSNPIARRWETGERKFAVARPPSDNQEKR